MSTSASPPERLGLVRWLVVILASIGFAFDIYELLMLPLIVRPALLELTGVRPGTPEFSQYVALLFYVPAVAGGIFGLLGGYLTDRLGRRRVLTWSILLYACSAFASGFATSVWMLLVLRCFTFIGVCVEFVAAIAWLAELFSNPEQREKVIGYTQAFSSVGGLLVAVANGVVISILSTNPEMLPRISMPGFLQGIFGDVQNSQGAWRYTLMSGLIPAIPLILIRPFLPESPGWKQKKESGTLKRPSIGQLFAPGLRRTTIVTTIMFACSYGAAFGALQHLPRIVPGLEDVKEEVKDLSPKEQALASQEVGAEYTKVQEIGGLVGRFVLALLVIRIVSRRSLMRVFQFPGLIILPLVFYFLLTIENQTFFKIDLRAIHLGVLPITTVSLGVFFAGLFTIGQFSFWGNYLPRVYPLHLRGTGESFAANIGGRMIGTSFAAVTALLSTMYVDRYLMPGETPEARLATTCAAVGLFVYVVGSIACFFLPEPAAEDLPEEDYHPTEVTQAGKHVSE